MKICKYCGWSDPLSCNIVCEHCGGMMEFGETHDARQACICQHCGALKKTPDQICVCQKDVGAEIRSVREQSHLRSGDSIGQVTAPHPEMTRDVLVNPGYEPVLDVLIQALDQTQSGKGKERHASDNPFLEQEIMNGARCCGLGSMIFQVRKKALEAERLAYNGEFQKAKTDTLGSIIYDVALYLRIEEMENE